MSKTKDNPFSYESGTERDRLINIFYDLLKTKNPVSYTDVIKKRDPNFDDINSKISSHADYNTLKKAITVDVIPAFNKYNIPYIKNGRGTKVSYQYIGTHPSPLAFLRFRARLERLKEDLAKSINNKRVVSFKYEPFGRKAYTLKLHPHMLYEYNNRLYVFGVTEKEGSEKKRETCIALDRIQDDIETLYKEEYIPAEPNEYNFLNNIIGVSKAESDEIYDIRIRTFDKYTFGRLNSKPLHHSQKTTSFPNYSKGIAGGDFTIQTAINKELITKLIEYGSNIEILEPAIVRDKVVEELKKALDRYEPLSSPDSSQD
ncbi:MAG: WYL domain-containing protein [Bacteroidales bacterium]|nr:WYL domain-containing protein [Candidatus Sodaliphilus limicaballi]